MQYDLLEDHAACVSVPFRWIVRNVLRDTSVFSAIAADHAIMVPILPNGSARSAKGQVDAFGRHRFECAYDGTQ